MLLLKQLPIDIVEMVIVISDSYFSFEKLKTILPKLQESQRLERINDKLTKMDIINDGVHYSLNGSYHREYDKPCYISSVPTYFCSIYSYKKNGISVRKNGYNNINMGCRGRIDEHIYLHITYLNHVSTILYEKARNAINFYIE